jgi:exosome complex RNA-binding protein Csl4
VIRRSRTYSGEIWTDAGGRATIHLPADVDLVSTAVHCRLEPGDGIRARVVSASTDGHVSIETDEPHAKVGWRVTTRRRPRLQKGETTDA